MLARSFQNKQKERETIFLTLAGKMIFDIDAVKTGKYRKGDEMQTSKAVKLYATFADFIQQELFNNAILSD